MGELREVIVERPGGVSLNAPLPQSRKTTGLPRCKKERPSVTVSAEYLRGLALTERDRDIVRYLGEIGYSTTDQVARMFFAGVHSNVLARRRLLRLWKWHVLDRTTGYGLQKYGLPVQLVYTPGAAGLLMLNEDDPEGSKTRRKRGTNLLYHNVLLGEALASLSETARAGEYDLTFYGERGTYAHFQWNERIVKIRPDGLLFVRREKELPFFLELDTGMREAESFTAKVFQYELYCASCVWQARHSQFPGIAVIVCATAPDQSNAASRRIERAERRLRQAIDTVKAQRKDNAITWFFTRLDQVGSGKWLALDKQGAIRQIHLFTPPADSATEPKQR